jgi:hypothetical protein
MTEANIAPVTWQQSWVSLLPPSCQGRAVGRVEATFQAAPKRGRSGKVGIERQRKNERFNLATSI